MKDIKGYEGLYAITDDGKVWAYPKCRWSGRFLKIGLVGHGYEIVMLYKNKKPRKFLVHRLVAQTFLPKSKFPEVNHKNGNRRDNRPENLEWVTSMENKRQAWKMGLYVKPGQLHWNAKLDREKVSKIRELYSGGNYTQQEIADEFKVSLMTISLVVRWKIWKHVF
jgi:hypothetical protein